jgi:predicted Rossmann fold flavoprotein
MIDVAVIGGGASGLAAAVNAKKINSSLNVAIVEALPRVGKKILATGNGRCNITNVSADKNKYNLPEFVSFALSEYSPIRVIKFFESIGLKTVTDSEGRVYPMSNTASSVLDCLRFECENLGIEFILNCHVNTLKILNNYFIINDEIKAKKIIIATSGKAAPPQGSDGSGFEIAKKLGHSVTELYPGLVPLTVKETSAKALKGVRVKAHIDLYSENKIIDSSNGEVLFTEYGLSGISVMDISRSVKNSSCKCVLDMLPDLSDEDINEFLLSSVNRNPNLTAENVLVGIMNKRIGQAVLKSCGIPLNKEISSIKQSDIDALIYTAKHFNFTITGTRGFNNAQITVGGIKADEILPESMESKLINNLYFAGEIEDIDSVCGGFNLQWAWSSGLLAGKSAAET